MCHIPTANSIDLWEGMLVVWRGQHLLFSPSPSSSAHRGPLTALAPRKQSYENRTSLHSKLIADQKFDRKTWWFQYKVSDWNFFMLIQLGLKGNLIWSLNYLSFSIAFNYLSFSIAFLVKHALFVLLSSESYLYFLFSFCFFAASLTLYRWNWSCGWLIHTRQRLCIAASGSDKELAGWL